MPKVVFISQGGSTTLLYTSEALSSATVSLTLGASSSSSCMFIGVNLELSSLVLQNKSHPSFLVGDCTQYFLQVKCTSCMVRNILIRHVHNDKLLCIKI